MGQGRGRVRHYLSLAAWCRVTMVQGDDGAQSGSRINQTAIYVDINRRAMTVRCPTP